MIGRELSAIFPKRTVRARRRRARAAPRLTCAAAGVRDVSLEVRSGEIVGLAGLVGSGRTELAQTVFGLTPADSGEVLVHGRPVVVRSPAGAIEAGIGYLPEDRKQHGVVPEMAVDENVSLANLGAVCARRADRSRARAESGAAVRRSAPDQDCVGRRPRSSRSPAATSRRSRSRAGWRPRRRCSSSTSRRRESTSVRSRRSTRSCRIWPSAAWRC